MFYLSWFDFFFWLIFMFLLEFDFGFCWYWLILLCTCIYPLYFASFLCLLSASCLLSLVVSLFVNWPCSFLRLFVFALLMWLRFWLNRIYPQIFMLSLFDCSLVKEFSLAWVMFNILLGKCFYDLFWYLLDCIGLDLYAYFFMQFVLTCG